MVATNSNNSLTIVGEVTVEAWVNLETIHIGPIVYKNQNGNGSDNRDNYCLAVSGDGNFNFKNVKIYIFIFELCQKKRRARIPALLEYFL